MFSNLSSSALLSVSILEPSQDWGQNPARTELART